MRRIWTEIVRTFFVLSLVTACDAGLQDAPVNPQEVGMYVSGVQTRTEMQPNGLSTVWNDNDEIAVWARNSSDDYVLSAQVFKMYGFSEGSGFFTSTLDSPMPDQEYTYLCSYPVPESVNGTKVTFDIPSVQNGKVASGAGVMFSKPVTYGPLVALEQVSDEDRMSVNMKHVLHQFRFYIPDNVTVLDGGSVRSIKLTFPREVVGKVTFDISDLSAPPVLSEGSREVMLDLEDDLEVSLDENNRRYACVAIMPTTFSEGETLEIKAYSGHHLAQVEPVDLRARTFSAGYSTPVRLNITSLQEMSRISFRISGNNLGEGVNSITLKAPEGCLWGEDGSNETVYSPGHKMTTGETVDFYFEDESKYKAFSGKSITVIYDSDNAIVSETIISGTVSGTVHEITSAVPYLFQEDFSGLSEYNGDYTAGPYTSVDGASTEARNLSQYGLSSGWTGARTGCDAAGTAILVGGRVDCVIAGATRAYGRLESPQLSAIKPGKEVKVKVSFNYSGSRNGNSTYYPVGVCGYVTESGLLKGYATQFNNSEAWNGIYDYSSIPDIPTSGSASNATMSMTYNINDCTSAHRLSWHVAGMGYKSWKINNGNQWMYVDNVKVQIAQ